MSARLSEPLDKMEDDVTVLADSDLRIAAEAVPYLNYFLYVRMHLFRNISRATVLQKCRISRVEFSETQFGVELLQEEALGSVAGVEAVSADRRGHEAGQRGHSGVSHRPEHGVSLRREDVRSGQDLRADGDSSLQAIRHGHIRQSQRSVHRNGENRVSFRSKKLISCHFHDKDARLSWKQFFFLDCTRCSIPDCGIVR